MPGREYNVTSKTFHSREEKFLEKWARCPQSVTMPLRLRDGHEIWKLVWCWEKKQAVRSQKPWGQWIHLHVSSAVKLDDNISYSAEWLSCRVLKHFVQAKLSINAKFWQDSGIAETTVKIIIRVGRGVSCPNFFYIWLNWVWILTLSGSDVPSGAWIILVLPTDEVPSGQGQSIQSPAWTLR